MLVQIIKATHECMWYKDRIFETFEVKEDPIRKNLYFVTKKQMRKMGSNATNELAILKVDCEPVLDII